MAGKLNCPKHQSFLECGLAHKRAENMFCTQEKRANPSKQSSELGRQQKVRDEKPNNVLNSSREGHITRQVKKPNLAERKNQCEETANDIPNGRRGDDVLVSAFRMEQDGIERPKT